MIKFAEEVTKGDMQGTSAILYGYGLYLLGGGTPRGFRELTPSDVQIMIQVHDCIEARRRNDRNEDILKMFGKSTGGVA